MWNCADDNGKYHMCGTFSCVPIWGKDVSFNNKYGQYTVCTYAALSRVNGGITPSPWITHHPKTNKRERITIKGYFYKDTCCIVLRQITRIYCTTLFSIPVVWFL